MQDKEFDKIFKQKFEDFEVEPSSTVWGDIVEKLDGKKRIRSILPWLSIAATLLIVVTGGLLFLNKGEQAGAPRKGNKLIPSRVKPAVIVQKQEVSTKRANPLFSAKLVQIVQVTKVTVPVSRHQQQTVASPNLAIARKETIPVNVTPADVVDHEPMNNNQPIIAALANPASTKVQTTLPDVQLAPKVLATEVQDISALTASAEGHKPEKKHGIRNMGGLINAIVARLDKRDNKLIEFSDGDEDDDNGTVVTGVNLGLIKIKKQ